MGIRHGCTYVGAWIMATTAAVVLSWFGVRGVLHDAMVEHVRPLPPHRNVEQPSPRATTTPTSTPNQETATSDAPEPARDRPSAPPSGRTTENDHDTASKRVRGYDVAGGRVTLAVYPDHVRLISAVPNPGYEVKTWRNDQWLRVDLISPEGRSAVFATWNGHPPHIRVVEY